MENYGKILGLVEEVRDILDLHEAKKKGKGKSKKVTPKQKAALGSKFSSMMKKKKKGKGYDPKGDEDQDWAKKVKKGHKSKTKHNPFKGLKNIKITKKALEKDLANLKAGKPAFYHSKSKSGEISVHQSTGAAHLGKGPRGSTSVPGVPRGIWKCRCRNYKCLCKNTNEGTHKKVVIDKGKKKTYNIAYRKWRKAHKSRYQPGKGKWKPEKHVQREHD